MSKKQESLWLKHDADASGDPKIVKLISVYNYAGYGRFWRIIEMLRMEQDNRIPLIGKYAYTGVADLLKMSTEDAEKFITDCVDEFDLFVIEDGYLFSNRVINDMLDVNAKRQQTRNAGLASAEARRNKQKSKPRKREPQIEKPVVEPSNEFEGLTEQDIADWNVFLAWIKKNDYTRVQKLPKPLTPKQFAKLLGGKKYTGDMVRETFIRMENWKPLHTKSVSAYDTLRVWMDKDLNKN